jgi:hypothetical protein
VTAHPSRVLGRAAATPLPVTQAGTRGGQRDAVPILGTALEGWSHLLSQS